MHTYIDDLGLAKLTPTLGNQINIHPLGGYIHPAGDSMQDISRTVERAKLFIY